MAQTVDQGLQQMPTDGKLALSYMLHLVFSLADHFFVGTGVVQLDPWYAGISPRTVLSYT